MSQKWVCPRFQYRVVKLTAGPRFESIKSYTLVHRYQLYHKSSFIERIDDREDDIAAR